MWAELQLKTNVNNPNVLTKSQKELIIKHAQQLDLEIVELFDDSDGFITIELSNQNNINDQFINDIGDKLKLLLMKKIKFSINEINLIIKSQIPNNTVINCRPLKVTLFFEEQVSLHNIQKQIKDCAFLFIPTNAIYNKIKSSVLGLLLINNVDIEFPSDNVLNDDHNLKWALIVKKHLKADRDVLECQEELIENGYKELAKL